MDGNVGSECLKYIVVSGGVISGLGKGVAAASLGMFFSRDYNVVPIKLDGYLNVDPGTMNPLEHGEVFVLDDGAEVDMDFGHYERFLDVSCHKEQSITMGKIYKIIRVRERRGDYLGKTVQLIPHVTNLIQEQIESIAKKSASESTRPTICMVELGGTVGDIESDLYIEALRQFQAKVGKENIAYLHLTYVPIPYGVNEQKTKPTQQSINLLQSKGIWPDLIMCRCANLLTDEVKKKIALFASLKKEDIISAIDVDCIYKVPKVFDEQGLVERVCEKLHLRVPDKEKLSVWTDLLKTKKDDNVKIAIAGKYTDLEDSYASLIESLNHCSFHFGVNVKVLWIETSNSIDYDLMMGCDAIIVPGGFGTRGVEGKIEVIKFARENKIPFLGICYGLQLAIVEFLRNVCSIKDATSLEIDENAKNPAITILEEQKSITKKGGTMRLGVYDAVLQNGIIKDLYEELELFRIDGDKFIVSERHRHRFEVNPDYKKYFEDKGLIVCGKSVERDLVEFIELDSNLHPYFVATQSHPELKSKLEKPAPLFYGLVKKALELKKEKENKVEVLV